MLSGFFIDLILSWLFSFYLAVFVALDHIAFFNVSPNSWCWYRKSNPDFTSLTSSLKRFPAQSSLRVNHDTFADQTDQVVAFDIPIGNHTCYRTHLRNQYFANFSVTHNNLFHLLLEHTPSRLSPRWSHRRWSNTGSFNFLVLSHFTGGWRDGPWNQTIIASDAEASQYIRFWNPNHAFYEWCFTATFSVESFNNESDNASTEPSTSPFTITFSCLKFPTVPGVFRFHQSVMCLRVRMLLTAKIWPRLAASSRASRSDSITTIFHRLVAHHPDQASERVDGPASLIRLPVSSNIAFEDGHSSLRLPQCHRCGVPFLYHHRGLRKPWPLSSDASMIEPTATLSGFAQVQQFSFE